MSILSIVLIISLGSGPAAQTGTYTPRPGSPERKAILDSVRRELDIKSQFLVYHMMVNDRWCFFRGGEVVVVDGEQQETDLGVSALIQRTGTGANQSWKVILIWTLPTEDERPYDQFVTEVRRLRKAEKIHPSIFPDDL